MASDHQGNENHSVDFNLLNESAPSNVTRERGVAEETIYCIAASLLLLSALLLHILIIVTIVKAKRLRTDKYLYTLNICVSDISTIAVCLSAIMFTPSVHMNNHHWPFGVHLCNIQGLFLAVSLFVSYASITLITFDRYCCIVHSRYYSQWFTAKRKKIYLICTWIYSFVLVFPSLVGWGHIHYSYSVQICTFDWTYSDSYAWFVIMLGGVIPMLLVTYMYAHVLYVFACRRRRAMSFHQVSTRTRHSMRNASTDITLAFKMLAIVMTAVLGFAPYVAVEVIFDRNDDVSLVLYDFLRILVALKVLTDAILYFFIIDALRKESKVLLFGNKRRNGDVTNESLNSIRKIPSGDNWERTSK